jgi:serine protease AprX
LSYVIAVGAADSNGTRSRGDDTVATFSSRGNATRHADLLAPGRSVVSLRVPGSYIDTEYPGARVGDEAGAERFFRGSGTSQAAAVISGTVALLLERRPNLNPDEVKALLMQTADPIAFATPIEAGAGQVDLAAAVTRPTPAKATQTARQATGLGTLEQARGTSHVTDETGVSLVGEQDIFGAPWDPARWTKAAGDGKAWSGGIWNGNIWAGDDFGGKSWAKRTWKGATWTGRSWNGRSWNGRSWNGRSWNGRSWNGRSWTDATGADA